jgi:hypothetical protein
MKFPLESNFSFGARVYPLITYTFDRPPNVRANYANDMLKCFRI